MKPKSIKSLLALALLAPGALFAQTTAKTTPVGYETVSIASGFNYIGLRLHNPALVAGTLEFVTSSAVTDSNVNIQSSVVAGKTYILEVETAGSTGAVAEVLGSDIAAGVITTPNNLVAVGAAAGNSYILRESATLNSVFGATNSAGLTPGFSGPTGADVLYVPDGTGNFGQYFYDEDNATWTDAVTNSPVDGANIPLVYLDGIVVFANGTVNLTVSGEVKKTNVIQSVASGFNYLSSVFPAGATLASAYTGSLSTIHPGFSGPTDADVVYVPGVNGLASYFYDEDNATWTDAVSNTAVDASTIDLPSGIIYFNAGDGINLKNSAPTNYSTL